jgi:hypothetical protein
VPDEDIGSRQGEITMNEKLAGRRKIVEEPSKQEIAMVYLDAKVCWCGKTREECKCPEGFSEATK